MANIGQELLNVPFPKMVESMGMAIAQAQYALDMNSIKIAQVMSGAPWLEFDAEGKEVVRDGLKINFGGRQLSLLELGFTPTFYQFVDTIIEVKISMSMKSETEEKSSQTSVSAKAAGGFYLVGGGITASVSTVSASFAARNSFAAEGASLLRTKLVPLPPPAVLQERIRAMLEESRKAEPAVAVTIAPTPLALKEGEEREVTVTFPKATAYSEVSVDWEAPSNGGTGTVVRPAAPTITSPASGASSEKFTIKIEAKAATAASVIVGTWILIVKKKDAAGKDSKVAEAKVLITKPKTP